MNLLEQSRRIWESQEAPIVLIGAASQSWELRQTRPVIGVCGLFFGVELAPGRR